MGKANMDVREAARVAGVCLWQISEEYGCNDSAFSRKLRHELPDTEKRKIFGIIDRLKEEKHDDEGQRADS